MRKTTLGRLGIVVLVAFLHLGFILFFVISVEAVILAIEEPVMVMKLTDIAEEIPLPPPPPPPPADLPDNIPDNAVEAIAEHMIETEEEPENQVVVPAGTLVDHHPPVRYEGGEENYLQMHQVSVAPRFSERDILRALVYPPIALRSGIEGTVYLELFIDREGAIKRITILRETPEGRGFGEAAVKAFDGLRCTPAEANGTPVAVRYRYPVRFAIRG